MLNLDPLIARLVDEVLRAVGDATLGELGALTEPARAAPVVKPPTRSARVAARRGAKPVQASAHARSPARPAKRRAVRHSTPPERIGVDDITDPEQLLVPMLQPLPTERVSLATRTAGSGLRFEPEEKTPASRALRAFPPSLLRAGESVARSSAAGVVIRRAKKA